MIPFENIKLVVWDFDETFGKGTLTEGGVEAIPENIDLVRKLTDCGIVNAICSKNDDVPVQAKLSDWNIAEYFVFNSIDWTPKGTRIQTMLNEMGLRPVNVLFLDDNPVNLNEAKHYSKGLMVGTPDDIPALREWASRQPTKDPQHQRLNQYKVLQSKQESKKNFSSNEEFLFSTHTRVTLRNDCIEHIDRIHELVLRTNQLNYTKLRSTREDLENILQDPRYECAYVNVHDDFGDYGTIGFYALDKAAHRLLHFLFSCRTIGQGVEQYVYAKLGYPQLEVVGEVINLVTDAPVPEWINQKISGTDKQTAETILSGAKLLFKGPCDLDSAINYIKSNDAIETEFTYVKEGTNQTFYTHNHSAQILDLLLSKEEKTQILKDCSFVDEQMLYGKFFTGDYDWIVLSTFLESDIGVYHKNSNPGIRVAVGFVNKPIAEEKNWQFYEKTSSEQPYLSLSEAEIRSFIQQYTYDGCTQPEDYLCFLDTALEKLPKKTKLCLILGATLYHEDKETIKRHELLNQAIVTYSSNHPRVKYVKIDDCLTGRHDYTNWINHFKKIVYYRLSQKIIACINQDGEYGLQQVSRNFVFLDSIAWWISRKMREGSFLKTQLRRIYRRLKGKS